MASLSAGNFTDSTVHLLAFESLAEVSALSFWFRGKCVLLDTIVKVLF